MTQHSHQTEATQESPESFITIGYRSKNFKFSLPSRYSAGDTLAENEAKALNGLLGENIRNNFNKKLEDMIAEGKHEHEIHQAFNEYAESYTFANTGARGPRTPADPVGKEAHKIASEILQSALKQKGKSRKDLAEGLFDKLVSQLIEQNPKIREEAEKRIAASKAMGSDILEGLI